MNLTRNYGPNPFHGSRAHGTSTALTPGRLSVLPPTLLASITASVPRGGLKP
jgi:hypothetical protein